MGLLTAIAIVIALAVDFLLLPSLLLVGLRKEELNSEKGELNSEKGEHYNDQPMVQAA